jgi:hypothetical protein
VVRGLSREGRWLWVVAFASVRLIGINDRCQPKAAARDQGAAAGTVAPTTIAEKHVPHHLAPGVSIFFLFQYVGLISRRF